MTIDEALAMLFRQAVRAAHPDVGGSVEAMSRVSEARDVLSQSLERGDGMSSTGDTQEEIVAGRIVARELLLVGEDPEKCIRLGFDAKGQPEVLVGESWEEGNRVRIDFGDDGMPVIWVESSDFHSCIVPYQIDVYRYRAGVTVGVRQTGSVLLYDDDGKIIEQLGPSDP